MRWFIEEFILDCVELARIAARFLLHSLPYLAAAYVTAMAFSFLGLFLLIILGG